ncbi:MAG TPA: ester cyclase [Ktedonosporobacter sp.]|nr:ester cyclase [Ktedonosporobacter sp.]
MSTEENKAVIRRLIEEFINQGNTAVAEALVAEDHVALDPVPGQEQGRAGLVASIARMRTAFPDLEWTIEDQVAEGDTVAVSFVWRGTHQGEFLGIPPTGKRVTVSGMGFDYCAAGQCKKSRIVMDTMSLMHQLGVVPPPGQ